MTAKQFKQIRLALALSQAAFAVKLGKRVSTISRWETGVVKVPKYAVWALKGMLTKHQPGERK
jgi:DNA-binding transcriptional regulator YiaG